MTETDATRPAGPIAYLTGEYPKVSHTFIEREIAALEAQGLAVMPCTVRRPPPAQVVGPAQQAEAARTFGVLEAARSPVRLAAAHLALVARAPGTWGRMLALAWRIRPPGLKAALWQLFYFLEAGVLAQELRRRGARHIHNHFGDSSGTVTMLAAALAGIPFSFTLHGPTIFFEPAKWALGEKTARAAFVVCISHFCRSQAMLFSDPAHWAKLKIVHCGVTPARYDSGPRGSFGQNVLFVGRIDPVKGVPLLLDAFAAAARGRPGARLTVVGDGPARAAAEAQAAALGIADRVAFAGYQDQEGVARALAAADMLVLPSFAEGVPVVLMEAMAARIPVIASRVAGVQELVEDGVSGYAIPPGDTATLAERLGRLLDDPDLCRRMGEAGREKVTAEFDLAAETRRLAALF